MATDGHCPMSTLHWEIWLAGQAHLKESSRERYAGILREHIIPVWGEAAAGQRQPRRRPGVGHPACCPAIGGDHQEGTPVLSLILDLAVRDGRLRATWRRRSTCRGRSWPSSAI